MGDFILIIIRCLKIAGGNYGRGSNFSINLAKLLRSRILMLGGSLFILF